MRIRRFLGPAVALAAALSVLPTVPAGAVVRVAATPAATASANGRVHAVVEVGGVAYVGGAFTEVRRPDGSTVTRNRLAAIGTATGNVTSWNPDANGTVLALAASSDGSRIFAGGDFTQVKGKSRARLAKLYTDTGGVSSWNPGASSSVRAIAVKGSGVYVGGTFSTVKGVTVDGLAKLSGSSGSVSTSFKPRPNGGVRSLALAHDESRLYVGGNLTGIGGSSRRYLASVSTSSGSAKSWAPNPEFVVFSVGVGPEGSRVYAGGAGTGGRLAAFDGATGALDGWNPGADSITGVYAVAAGARHLWVGGDFTVIGGRNQPRLAGFPGPP